MYIIKRNGEQNEFNIEKITNAVEAANLSVSEEKQLTYHQIMSIAEKNTWFEKSSFGRRNIRYGRR